MILDFEHQKAAHCENGVTSNMLRFYGYEYSEPLLFGLSSSLYFVHLPFIKLAGFPVISFRPLPGLIFSRTTNLLGFKTTTRIFFNQQKAMERLDGLLKKGIPAGVVVGMYYLPYMPIEYRFHFNAHNLSIFGKEDDQYWVSDPIALEKVTISSRDLQRARFAKGTYPPMGKLYWINSLPKKTPDLNKLIRKAIRKNCFRMVHMAGPMPLIGTNGIHYLAKKIPHFPQKYGYRKAGLYLAQIVRMMEEIGTGGAGFRFLYAAFLQEAAAITQIDQLNTFSQRLTDIGDLWRNFAAEAGRICKNRSSENVDYNTISALLSDIGDQEKQFFLDLEKVV